MQLRRFKLQLLLLPLLALALWSTGCAKAKYQPHPGAIDSIDSYAYDVCLGYQDALNQTKLQIQSGKLPASAKDPANVAIASYNLACVNLGPAYHNGAMHDAVKLSNAINQMIADVAAFKKAVQ